MIRGIILSMLLLPTISFAADGDVGRTSSATCNITITIAPRVGFEQIEDEKTHKMKTVDVSNIPYKSFYTDVEVKTKDKKVRKQRVLVYMPDINK